MKTKQMFKIGDNVKTNKGLVGVVVGASKAGGYTYVSVGGDKPTQFADKRLTIVPKRGRPVGSKNKNGDYEKAVKFFKEIGVIPSKKDTKTCEPYDYSLVKPHFSHSETKKEALDNAQQVKGYSKYGTDQSFVGVFLAGAIVATAVCMILITPWVCSLA